MAYAPIFSGLIMLWALVALLGGQGFSPLVGLCGLAGLAFARAGPPVRTYAVAGLAFVAWAALSALWSPAGGPFVSGAIRDGTFSVNAASVRLVAVALSVTLVFMAMSRVPAASAPRSRWTLAAAFGVAGLMLVLSAIFLQPMLALAYDDPHEAMTAGIQNALRQANAFSIALPILLAMIWSARPDWMARGAAIACGVLAGLVFARFGSAAALMALVFAALAMGLVKLLPQRGFFALSGIWAGSILAAPLVFAHMGRLIDASGLPVPFSFHSRIYAWRSVGERIWEKPLTGHGLEAAGTWDATYASRPEWLSELTALGGQPQAWSNYRIIPGHPHNMPLEIWADTGLVGAALAVLALLALGLRLPAPERLVPEARFAAAGIMGAALSLFCFSYSMWNEAAWAMVALAGAGAMLLARQGAQPE